MAQQQGSLFSRFRRGHVLTRLKGRVIRELQSAATTVTLSFTKPRAGVVAIVTLNADEENATVQAVLDGQNAHTSRIIFVSPDPAVSRDAVARAARRLDATAPSHVVYLPLGYGNLLKSYRVSERTFSTHVLLPGRDHSGRRIHTHLTHGSGPKPDTTFRAPTNVLASITPRWVTQQLREYQLPENTPVIERQPRLEIMKRALGDRSILDCLGLDQEAKLAVWAPTYRSVARAGGEVRVSGVPFTNTEYWEPLISELDRKIHNAGYNTLIAKVHPHDADSLRHFGMPTFTNEDLQIHAVTPYELFGVADIVITDYSSLYTERAHLNLPFWIWTPDREVFSNGYRGLRSNDPMFQSSPSLR